MTARRTTPRFPAAVALLALAVSGCATEDYGYAREHRFDRPYRGGAANVSTSPPKSTSSAKSSKSDDVAVLAYLAALTIAIVGHADISCSIPPEPPPPPSPSGR